MTPPIQLSDVAAKSSSGRHVLDDPLCMAREEGMAVLRRKTPTAAKARACTHSQRTGLVRRLISGLRVRGSEAEGAHAGPRRLDCSPHLGA